MASLDSLDSRIRSLRGARTMGRNFGVAVLGQPVFCVSCGCVGGLVTAELPPGVIYLCGNDDSCGHNCEGRFGRPPEMMVKKPDPDDFRRV